MSTLPIEAWMEAKRIAFPMSLKNFFEESSEGIDEAFFIDRLFL
jgi:hypothetical protein